MWMNEHEVETAARRHLNHPVLGPATATLASLVEGTNACSDGWPYWRLPSGAARQLMSMITSAEAAERTVHHLPPDDVLVTQLRRAYAQLRGFRTKRQECKFRIFAAPGVPGDEPEPEQAPALEQHQIKITVRGNRAEVEVVGGTPLAPGRYRGAVVKLSDRRTAAA